MKLIFSFASVLLVFFLLTSCARKMNFAPSSVVPAATGKVKVKKDDNNNYTLTIDVLNLAEANKLNPPRSVYVVWLDADGSGSRNIGQISPSSSLFSKSLKAELKATATSKPDRVYITAEDNGNVQYPGSQVVLTTQ